MEEKEMKKDHWIIIIINKIASYFEVILKDYNKYLNKIEIIINAKINQMNYG